MPGQHAGLTRGRVNVGRNCRQESVEGKAAQAQKARHVTGTHFGSRRHWRLHEQSMPAVWVPVSSQKIGVGRAGAPQEPAGRSPDGSPGWGPGEPPGWDPARPTGRPLGSGPPFAAGLGSPAPLPRAPCPPAACSPPPRWRGCRAPTGCRPVCGGVWGGGSWCVCVCVWGGWGWGPPRGGRKRAR